METRKRRMAVPKETEIEVEGGEGLDMLGRVVVAVASSEQSTERTNSPATPPGDPGYLLYLLAMVDHVRTKTRKRDRSGAEKGQVSEGQSISDAITELEASWRNMSEARRSEWRSQSSILEDTSSLAKSRYWGNGGCSVSFSASHRGLRVCHSRSKRKAPGV
jgi:hypothetical protein